MNAPDQNDWHPEPHFLDAYFDGEMEGCDEAADLRTRLEAWVEQHPQAREQWAERQALRRLWMETTPREPGVACWNRVLERIESEGRRPVLPMFRRLGPSIGAIAAGIAAIVGLVYGAVHHFSSPSVTKDAVAVATVNAVPRDEGEILPVATSEEVVVTYIEGADTRAIAVGQLPVHEPLELAEVGEVRILAVRSNAPLTMQPQAPHDGPNRPMIWMPLQTD
jgi:hypothetical protein